MKQLDLMIHDLLDASKLRAGEPLELTFSECDLDVIVGNVAEETNALHGNRLKVESDGPALGHWNKVSIRRVVDNLVNNALKFSDPNSPITINIHQDAKSVEFGVHNVGNPIPAEEQSGLFLKYRRSKKAEGKEGWGLGLTVIRGLAEAHGGRVEVESSQAAGTTFRVFLPRNATHDRR